MCYTQNIATRHDVLTRFKLLIITQMLQKIYTNIYRSWRSLTTTQIKNFKCQLLGRNYCLHILLRTSYMHLASHKECWTHKPLAWFILFPLTFLWIRPVCIWNCYWKDLIEDGTEEFLPSPTIPKLWRLHVSLLSSNVRLFFAKTGSLNF